MSEFAGDLLNRRRSKMDKIAVNAFIHGGAISDLSQQYPFFSGSAGYIIRLNAASSAITVTSLCSCKMDAGTDGVIGP